MKELGTKLMPWKLPPTSLLSKSSAHNEADEMELAMKQGDLITDRLDSLGFPAEVEAITIGPQVISYSMVAADGVAIRKIPSLRAELLYETGANSLQVHAPKPGTKFITIEVDNPCRRMVRTGDVIDYAHSPLQFPLGISPDNSVLSADIKSLPHILIAGTTGGGKSVALHNMICSLLMKTTPDDLMFHMTDTKLVELPIYDGIPNLICDVVTDAYEAVEHFQALVSTMEKRYKLAQQYHAKDLDELNEKLSPDQKLPYILVIVDEIADLMMISKHSVEEAIVRIAQKARAIGIHLILATQSPRREVITGILKSNLPSRLAFSTSSELDSRIILDRNGAGSLCGNGDALFSNQGQSPVRLQSPFINSNEITSIVNHWQNQTYWKDNLAA